MPSLSQKYRPKKFSEITGQKQVTETLRQEVASGVLGHAYLFSGPRGIGKTTAARVLAKALNCLQPADGEPCNQCALCVSANQGRCLDLIELDAATHTGVDNVREAIIEHVRFAPMQGKRKIYVIDEAHMLSTSSWNALLKTLEEPPPYAFFILATTEWHKVPATIVSRCQRFEFRRVSEDVLTQRVMDVAKQEGWELEPDVARLIASRADGCVRDAETLLGQVGSLGATKLDLDVARLVIPPSHLPLAAGLLKMWADRDHANALQEAQRLSEQGIPLIPLFDDLLTIIRQLLRATADAGLAASWQKGTEEEQATAQLVGRFTPAELNDLALLLFERRRDAKSGVDPLFVLQLAGTVVAGGLLRNAQVQNLKSKIQSQELEVRSQTNPPTRESANPPTAPVSQPAKPTNPLNSSTVSAPLDLDAVRSKWPAVIRAVEEKNHSLPFILKLARPDEMRGNCLIIRFSYPFHQDKIVGDPKHKLLVEECLRVALENQSITIDGVVGEEEAAAKKPQDTVSSILKAFGGSVVE